MRTLFGENIRSPAPQSEAEAEPTVNPFELSFNSHPATTSDASNNSSFQQTDILTPFLQDSSRDERATSFSHGEPAVPPARRKGNPRLLFMGLQRYDFGVCCICIHSLISSLPRCGKSSIQKVVFQKLPPAETLYLDSTTRIEKASMQSFLTIDSAELPSHTSIPPIPHAPIFSQIGACIWIIDSQDEYLTSVAALMRLAIFLAETYPAVNLEVFIHKTDGLSAEYKYDTFREIRQRVQDELSDEGYGDRGVSYYQTSVFDHSIFEAMSKVVMKLLPTLPAMETLLTKLCATCRVRKAYLFDVGSKIYVATDASPSFLKDYEVCADWVDVIVDVKQLYGWREEQEMKTEKEGEEGERQWVGESSVTLDKSGDTYIYVREITE